MVTATDGDQDRDVLRLKDLLYRLRPGDQIEVTTFHDEYWREGRNMTVRAIVEKRLPHDDELYHQVHAKGEQQGEEDGFYVLMPEKPTGEKEKGANPAPEVYHHTQNPNAEYEERTKGRIIGITLSA